MKNTAAAKCDFAARGPVGKQPEYDGETTFKMCQRPPPSSIPVAEVIFDICVIKLSRYQKLELERTLWLEPLFERPMQHMAACSATVPNVTAGKKSDWICFSGATTAAMALSDIPS